MLFVELAPIRWTGANMLVLLGSTISRQGGIGGDPRGEHEMTMNPAGQVVFRRPVTASAT